MAETTRVNGADLSWEILGEGPDTVVWLNGIAMSIAHWRPFAEGLPGHRHLCHDFRGQVLSNRVPGPISLAGQARDLEALLDSLGLQKVHLAGTSYGSAVGFHFALAHPERVESMVVIDGADGVDPLMRAAIESWKAAAQASPSAFYRSLIPWTYSAAYIERSHRFFAEREKAIEGFPRAYFDSFVQLCDAFLELDMTPKLKRITCPTLVLEGEKDILTPGYGRRMAEAIPGARFVLVPGVGHAQVVEAPEPIIEEIRSFWARG